MQIFKKIPEELDSFQGDVILAVVGEDERPLRAANAWIDWRLYGTISDLISRNIFSGKFGEKCLMPTYGKFHFQKLILLGAGPLFEIPMVPSDEQGQRHWQQLAELIDQTVRSLRVETIGLSLPRYDIADHERALLKTLQASSLPTTTHLFMARAPAYGLGPIANLL